MNRRLVDRDQLEHGVAGVGEVVELPRRDDDHVAGLRLEGLSTDHEARPARTDDGELDIGMVCAPGPLPGATSPS